jgi:hypothetical protein
MMFPQFARPIELLRGIMTVENGVQRRMVVVAAHNSVTRNSVFRSHGHCTVSQPLLQTSSDGSTYLIARHWRWGGEFHDLTHRGWDVVGIMGLENDVYFTCSQCQQPVAIFQ